MERVVEDVDPYEINDVLSDECAESVGAITNRPHRMRDLHLIRHATQNSVVACDIVLAPEKALCVWLVRRTTNGRPYGVRLSKTGRRGHEALQNAPHTRLHLSGELSADKSD